MFGASLLLLASAFFSHPDKARPDLPANPEADMRVSGGADSLLADSAILGDLEKYAAVEAASASGFMGRDVLLLSKDRDRLRYYRLTGPGAPPKALPPLPFRLATVALPREGQGDTLMVGRDQGGDEEFQLYAYAPASGRLTLWPMPPGRASQALFAPGGRRFVYAHNPPQSSRWDIRSGDFLSSRQDRLVFRNSGLWSPADIDSSGKHILLLRTVSSFHTELFTLDLSRISAADTGTDTGVANATRLGGLAGLERPAAISWAQWLDPPKPGNRGRIVLLSDGPTEFPALYVWEGGDSLRALSPPCACEVEAAMVLPGTRLVAFSFNRQATSELHLAHADSGWVKPMPGLPEGTLVHWQADAKSRRIVISLAHFGSPGDLYVYDWGRHQATLWMRAPGLKLLPRPRYRAGKPRRAQIPPRHPLPAPQTALPAWIDAPKAHDRPSPVLVHIHGGPEMQSRPGWDPLNRYLLEQWGVAIAYPDLRGSSGYGKAFLAADDGGRRPKVMSDLGAVLDYLARDTALDRSRIALTGRSYGGFVSQAGAIDYGPRLRSAISAVGIADFPEFLRQTRDYRRDIRRMEYGDERDSVQAAFLDSLSPLRRMRELKVPLLLMHGRRDPRVPYAQSLAVFAELAQRQAPALLLTENEEGHSPRGQNARARQMALSARFLIGTLGLRRR